MNEPTRQRDGFLAAAAAYGLWGLLPAYFVALDPSGPVEILALRIVLSLVFCVVILAVMRRLSRTTALLRDRNILKLSALAAVLILINWSVYVYASLNQFIVEAALGYFINPLVTVALGGDRPQRETSAPAVGSPESRGGGSGRLGSGVWVGSGYFAHSGVFLRFLRICEKSDGTRCQVFG